MSKQFAMSIPLSDLPKIKTVLEFLKGETSGCMAYYPKQLMDGVYQAWHVAIPDYTVYTSESFRLSREAIRTKFPKLKVVFVYQKEIKKAGMLIVQ